MLENYWRTVLSVFTGAAIAQIIPVLGALVIARQYGPSEFGLFSAWLAIVVILSTALTARLEMSLGLEKDGHYRNAAVFCVSLFTALLGGAIMLLALAVYVVSGYSYFDSIPMLLALAPGGMLLAANQIWQSWAAADGRFKNLTKIRIVQSLSVVLLQIAGGMFWPTATGLAVTYVAGLLLCQLYSIFLMPVHRGWWRRAIPLLRAYFARYVKFVKFSLPADFINSVSIQLPVMLVAERFGAESAGYLALSLRVLGMPLAFLGKAVLDVFKRQAALAFRERGECRSEYRRTFIVLAAGSVLFVLGMFFLAEPVFGIAFGKEWIPAGTVSVLLLPMFALRFIASPLSYVIYLAHKQHVDLVWQICLLSMTCVVIGFVSPEPFAILLYSSLYAALYVVYLAMSYRYSAGDEFKRG